MQEPPLTWRNRIAHRRWWIAAVALLIALRVALPIVLRRVIVSQASQALNAQVEVGDVDLALWKGGVTLEDVAVRARPAGPSTRAERTDADSSTQTPPVHPEPADARPASAPRPAFADNAPVIAFKRFAVELRYWPLFSKTVQLRDIELDSPRVALDRLASGDLNVMALMPKSDVAIAAGATPGAAGESAAPTPTATPAASEAAPSPWKLGLDRFVLRDGRLRFRDLALQGSEPVEVGIDEVTVQEIALSPGVYGEPAHVHVVLGVDSGVIDLAAELRLLEKGFAVTCEVNAQHLPLRRARLYVPKVGWSDLQGELDLALVYELEPDTKNQLRGTLALRDVAVAVPKLEDVAVGWRSFGVRIETIDLLAQRAAVAEVTLDGAKVDVRAQGGQPFPVLAALTAADAHTPTAEESPTPAVEESPTPTAEATKDEAAPAAPPPPPWDWSVASLRVSDSTVHILSDQPPLDVGVDLTATNLAAAADAIGHVALGLSVGPGALKLDGDLRIAAPAFGGTIQITDLALPPLVALNGSVDPAVLPSATFTANLAVQAGLPAQSGATAEPDLLRVSGALGLGDVRLSPPGQSDLTIEAQGLDLAITELTVPGVIPPGQKAASGAALRLAATLTLREPRVTRTGEQPMSVAAQSISLTLSDVALPAALAGLGPGDAAQPLHAAATLDLGAPRITLGSADLAVEARAINLTVSDATIAAVPQGVPATSAAPAHVVAQLDLAEPKIAIAGGKQLAAGAQAIALQLAELTVPGLVAGAPASDTGQPLHAVATLTLTQPRVARADGKEFSVAIKSIAVPVTDLSIPAALGSAPGAAQPMRAAFGDIRIDAPAIRLTRTKDGIVLPVAAPDPGARTNPSTPPPAPVGAEPVGGRAPAPAQPPQVAVASFRLTNGSVDFVDRAVRPVFQTRFAPIEIDARNIRFPDPSVKPLRIEITSAEQGHIIVSGDLGPQGGALELAVNDFSLAPFNPYAATYSPYGISDGALEIKTTAKFSEGKYEVSNALTLHQFDLAGAEGDSLFEQQFGIPLSMALALLRDASGDIDLNIPMQVDQSGTASIDVITVVRSALRQALTGAIESPLKLVGGVIGIGGKSGSIAPAPIAFPLGRAEPTAAGAESAQRLAGFLASRPGMAVQLDTAVTPDDVRWQREQALHREWTDEGFFARSLAFVMHRGPRERIGDYLRARADGQRAELSAEDAATLQQWLDQRPAPSPEQLRALAADRLAAVQTVLADQGIDAARVSHGAPDGEPAEGAPVVKIKFRPVAAPSPAHTESSTTP